MVRIPDEKGCADDAKGRQQQERRPGLRREGPGHARRPAAPGCDRARGRAGAGRCGSAGQDRRAPLTGHRLDGVVGRPAAGCSLPLPRPAGEHGAEPTRSGTGRSGSPGPGRTGQPVVEARAHRRACPASRTGHRSRPTIPTGTSLSPRACSSVSPREMRHSTRRLPNTTTSPMTPGWWSSATGARACRGHATSRPSCRKASGKRWPAVARCMCSTWATSTTRGWRPRTSGGSSTCGRSPRHRPMRA